MITTKLADLREDAELAGTSATKFDKLRGGSGMLFGTPTLPSVARRFARIVLLRRIAMVDMRGTSGPQPSSSASWNPGPRNRTVRQNPVAALSAETPSVCLTLSFWPWMKCAFHRMTQQPLPSPFSKVKRAARVAASNTSSTPSPLKLEHSRYFRAPTSLATESPC